MERIAGGIAVLMIAAVHIIFPLFDQLEPKRRHNIISLACGIAIGYVFLYLLPKLSDYTQIIIQKNQEGWEFFHYRTFLIALAGLVTYLTVYWSSSTHKATLSISVIYGLGFSMYNLITGYILANLPRPGPLPYLLVVMVLGLHFLGVDHQLRHWHLDFFDRLLRWILAAALLSGWVAGVAIYLPPAVLMYGISFFAGAIIINVMTEEIPELEEGGYLFFLLGILLFIMAAMIVRSIPKA